MQTNFLSVMGVRLFSGEAIGVYHHLFCQGSVCRHQVDECRTILHRGLFKIGKCHGHFHGVVSSSCDVPPLARGLLSFTQVGLRFDEVCLELSPGIFRI